MIAVLEEALVEAVRPRGLCEFHRVPDILRAEIDRVAHRAAVFFFRRGFFVIGRAVFSADHILRAREIAERSVPGRVYVDVRREAKALLRCHLIAFHREDLIHARDHALHRRVHERVQILRFERLGPQHAIPDRVVIAVVQILVFQLKLHQNACLRRVGLAPVAGRAGDVHSRLGACIAAEDAPVLYQRRFGAVPRRGDRCAQTAHAAADDDHIIVPQLRRIFRGNGGFVYKLLHNQDPFLLLSQSFCPMPDRHYLEMNARGPHQDSVRGRTCSGRTQFVGT